MTVDSTLTFAARRNVPVRYNRDLVATTLKAMSRVAEIRAKRERNFYRQRMAGNRKRQLEADRKLVAENQHLLPPEERDVPPEGLRIRAQREMEVEGVLLGEEVEMEEEEEEEVVPLAVKTRKAKVKKEKKLRLVRGGGVEAMDVDD